ncbi:cytochrome c oxidase subunit 4 [Brachybacterium halotolerans subsp. kimchii]|uniref:Cytochrome c oxidase polypeptide 4 n=2 Tax=Brachybacterium TaxID=43668 RepID=A0ABS1B5C9_9MICO|nr:MULTISPECIES: cytochrome c oxidase subunit 4 [Brachybacterium]MBK0329840.1 cytochrome c oxidase subunit 4 [Brachybacterium halotolerans]UEJ83373.1 cytochrome c oxidase subunit 4 [Brachybacterium halotolerans subsp. kimchii]UQN30969.1 cytochrome c oxidase subunit 4 [Brachybacterium kimchii]
MRTTALIFWILAAFFLIVGVVYGVWTGGYAPLGIETAGFPALLMATLLAAMIATTLTWASKRFPDRAEENLEAEVSDEAGVQGSFAPYSWWPLWAGIGCGLAFLGVAAGWWILAIGSVFVIVGVVGWVMEFSRGQHAH